MDSYTDLTEFNKELGNFAQNISNEFSAFAEYINLYFFWLYDNLSGALDKEFYKRRQELLEPYRAKEEGDIYFISGFESESPKEYDFSLTKSEKILEVNPKLNELNNESLFQRAVQRGWNNNTIWKFFIWKYFIQDKGMVYNIFTAPNNENTVSVDGAAFCGLCKKYRTKYGISEVIFQDEVEQRLSKLAKMNPYITEMPKGNFCYPESMQDAIIECVSMRYGKRKEEYPSKALELVGECIQKDTEALKKRKNVRDVKVSSSKRKRILSWRDNVKYYSFDTFAEANRRLFLESQVNMLTAESWDRLTGSLLTNSIYRTFKEMDERFKFIVSRMDEEVLKGLYFCVEKLLAIKELNYIEKAKFMNTMFSMLPLFAERIKKETDLKAILYSLGSAIRDFGIDGWHNVYMNELDKSGLLNYAEEVDEMSKEVTMYNEAFVKLWAENQKEAGDSPKNRNTIFFQGLSRAILYYIYS